MLHPVYATEKLPATTIDRLERLEKELERTKKELQSTDESLRVVRLGLREDGGVAQAAEKLALEQEAMNLRRELDQAQIRIRNFREEAEAEAVRVGELTREKQELTQSLAAGVAEAAGLRTRCAEREAEYALIERAVGAAREEKEAVLASHAALIQSHGDGVKALLAGKEALRDQCQARLARAEDAFKSQLDSLEKDHAAALTACLEQKEAAIDASARDARLLSSEREAREWLVAERDRAGEVKASLKEAGSDTVAAVLVMQLTAKEEEIKALQAGNSSNVKAMEERVVTAERAAERAREEQKAMEEAAEGPEGLLRQLREREAEYRPILHLLRC